MSAACEQCGPPRCCALQLAQRPIVIDDRGTVGYAGARLVRVVADVRRPYRALWISLELAQRLYPRGRATWIVWEHGPAEALERQY